ncbi:MAG TPA: murein biosynthesis integral membrane protein MurJ [Syntrophales bacterium]|nr:murein biosynthesis integral membrane protein MurJ [Syntrophales bacterium]
MEEGRKGGSENSKVAKAAGVVSLATMLSRIFGFLRDMVVAAFFGAGLTTDAFFIAFRIPNVLRRLIGEGSLTVSFVPVFTECLKNKKEEAYELADVAFTALSIILVIVSILGVIFSPLIVTLQVPGWYIKHPSHYHLTVFLNRLMFPYIFFMALVALCMGILNSLRHFAAPALSPVILNISMILAALLLRDYFAEPVIALAIGVMVGGILQLAMQWPFLIKLGVRLKPNFNFGHPGLKKIVLLLLPAAFGASVYQINVVVGGILASFLPTGSVSYLYYADRMVELPLGLFGIAIGTAALPSFSLQVANGDFHDLKRTISFSLRLVLFVTVPAMLALIVLAVPIISVLFERGVFSAVSTFLTAQALVCYAVGLWAFSVIRVIVSAFYSLQDAKSPMKAAIVALLVNVVCSIVLMFPMQHNGLALATSIATAVNVIMLSVNLKGKIGTFLDKDFYRSLFKIFVSSLAMWGVILLVEMLLPWQDHGSLRERILFLAVSIAAGMTTYFASACIIRCTEMRMIIDSVGRLVRRKFQ